MSTATNKLTYASAFTIAQTLYGRLLPFCERIEVAGSVRRRKAQIGDIELVAIPRGNQLHRALDERLSDGRIRHTDPKRWGEKWRAFQMDVPGIPWAVKADVFIVTPETWGVQLMIRTGSGVFSRNMVAAQSIGGFMPDGFKVQDGRLWRNGELLETPEEVDVFRAYGLDYVQPEDRTDEYRPSYGEAMQRVAEVPVVQAEQMTLFAAEANPRKLLGY